MTKILERARKLKAMMDDAAATENEVEQARSLLFSLLKREGLTLDALSSVHKDSYKFPFKNRWEKLLLFQIVGMVTNSTTIRSRTRGRSIYISLTRAEYCDIHDLYKLYRKEIEKEFDALLDAFFAKQHIYPDCVGTRDVTDVDEEFISRLRRHYNALNQLPDPRHKKLMSGD